MSLYASFVATLQCPRCQGRSRIDDIQTRACQEWDQMPRHIEVGATFPVSLSRERCVTGYLELRPVAAGEEIRLIETWDCGACGACFLWAAVVLTPAPGQHPRPRPHRLASITTAALTPALLDQAHGISDMLAFVYEDLTGEPMSTADFAARLRTSLSGR